MDYELSRLESRVSARPRIGVRGDKVRDDLRVSARSDNELEEEIARIRQAFMGMALSHKKEIFLRRYFRVHQDGLEFLVNSLKGRPRLKGADAKESKRLLGLTEDLLVYLKENFKRYLTPAPAVGLDPDDPDIDAQKVITTLSLAELGVIIRLFIEAGVFRVRNRKALTRFMSRNVVIRTKQIPEQFSEEHLYNAIHTPSEPAMNKLQTALNQMLVELNKLRREQRKKH